MIRSLIFLKLRENPMIDNLLLLKWLASNLDCIEANNFKENKIFQECQNN